ncbi:hypothetical protein F4825DRAFT_285773 [Nemania diffusa]|nr:hypothetical protein F4825DRAFT_285773 [Nemania diffusa]
MSATDDLLQQYQGHIVPRTFHPGFVILSFLVSFIGALSTLELLNRRTSGNGLRNHVLLVGAAVTMGGVSIWSMHFVGNRAIILDEDQPELQIAYSNGFTALSFFVPIIVLIAAFVATGTNNNVSFWRIGVGGTLAGGAMSGMFYIGNASIANYRCQYTLANDLGSAATAVASSNLSLSIFFLWRASWTSSWWRRGLCGAMLANAVSGMHWCASTGTNYQLLKLKQTGHFSRNDTIMVFIILSLSVALVVAGVVARDTWMAQSNTDNARHIILAAAIFDSSGRILVRPDGLLPSEKITETYVEKSPSDTFSIENPLFQWMFQASRSWSDINSMIPRMVEHVAHLSRDVSGRSVRLISENGQPIEDYDIVFRELFCLAAASLAVRLKEQLPDAGVLWDSILPTGKVRQYPLSEGKEDSCERGESASISESLGGLGSLMFLVRRVENPSDAQKLEAAGFRFADIRQVSYIIRSGMHIETPNLSQTLTDMASYAGKSTAMDPMVHLCFFGIRARLDRYGFDILVEKGARDNLLATKLPLERLEPWHTEFLRQYDGSKVLSVQKGLAAACRGRPPPEAALAFLLDDAISDLRARINDRIINEATFSCRTVQVPCQPHSGSKDMEECTVMVLHFMIPIHYSLHGSNCEFVPLSFFKVRQMAYKDSPYQAAFTQHLHRELMSAIKEPPAAAQKSTRKQDSRPYIRRLTLGLDSYRPSVFRPAKVEGNSVPIRRGRRLSRSSPDRVSLTTFKLYGWGLGMGRGSIEDVFSDTRPTNSMNANRERRHGPSLGGILVSQEINVAISQAEETASRASQGRSQSRNPSLLLPQRTQTPSPQHNDQTGTKTNKENGFEFDSTTETDTSRQVGKNQVSTAVAVGSDDEVVTFVDELFSLCVGFRYEASLNA